VRSHTGSLDEKVLKMSRCVLGRQGVRCSFLIQECAVCIACTLDQFINYGHLSHGCWLNGKCPFPVVPALATPGFDQKVSNALATLDSTRRFQMPWQPWIRLEGVRLLRQSKSGRNQRTLVRSTHAAGSRGVLGFECEETCDTTLSLSRGIYIISKEFYREGSRLNVSTSLGLPEVPAHSTLTRSPVPAAWRMGGN
jgi:hypothetical protein